MTNSSQNETGVSLCCDLRMVRRFLVFWFMNVVTCVQPDENLLSTRLSQEKKKKKKKKERILHHHHHPR